MDCTNSPHTCAPWNKGKLIGQKAPFKPKEVWAIRARLQMENRTGNWRCSIWASTASCVRDICHGDRVAGRATVLQQKTQRPVQFEISPDTRQAVEAWIRTASLTADNYLFRSRVRRSPHLRTRQYARILDGWLMSVGLIRRATERTRCGVPRRR